MQLQNVHPDALDRTLRTFGEDSDLDASADEVAANAPRWCEAPASSSSALADHIRRTAPGPNPAA